MQEYIINGLLVVVALLAVILQIIGTRPSAGMTKKQKVMLWRILTATVLLLILQVLGAGAFEVFGAAGRWVRLAVFLVDYLVIGYDILGKAGKGIRNGQVFDEHFLMAVATLGALALAIYENGDYLEAIAVMLFYQVGEWFQSYAVGKSRRNISDLMDIRPDYANIERDGKLEQVDPDEVGIGTIIVVQPGEKVPIDGMVVQGESTLNTAALTGESLPREVKTGDEIISGCINMTGLLHIQTTKEFGESTVSKILDLVENASSRKSKSEDFISRFAKIYTPAVCYAALALAILPPLVRMFGMGLDAGWETWIYRALTFLVASCPSALGLNEVYSELLPADKVEKVEELIQIKSEKEKLAFVGDGINDAPVLRRADIGIAMGAMGSDAAIEAADVVLMDDDPMQISKAIKISRKCLGIVYQNIVVAIGVKLACLVLIALGFANMWLAVFADVGVMIIAVLNAIRALFVKNL